jgi:hypothetical protein
MSFNVYNGAKIEGITSLKDVVTFIEKVRSIVIEEVHKDVARDIKRIACLFYDNYTFSGEDPFHKKDDVRKPLIVALTRIFEENRRRKDEYNLGITEVNGQVLALPFFPEEKYNDMFFNIPNVVRFGYWDSSDKEDDVSTKEWNKRKKLWDKAFTVSSVPAESFMVVRLLDSQVLVPDDKFMDNDIFPSVEERERGLARFLAIAKNDEDLANKETDFNKVKKQINKDYEDILPQVMGKLTPTITLEILGQEIPIKEEKSE